MRLAAAVTSTDRAAECPCPARMVWRTLPQATPSALLASRMASNRRTWPVWALTYLSIFRAVVVGGCLAIAAVAWVMHIQWLLAASVCIAAGEFLESTYYTMVLTWGPRTGRPAAMSRR